MAVVGSAHIVVRAITTGVKKDISKGFDGLDGVSSRAGKTTGQKFFGAFNRTQGGMFKKLSGGFRAVANDARVAQASWASLQKKGYVLQSAVGVLAGSLGSLVGALGSVVGMAGAVGAAGVALAGVFVSLKLAAFAAGLALQGIGAAVTAAWKQTAKADKANKASARAVEDARRNLARVIEGNAEELVDANRRIEKAQLDLNKAFKEGQEEVQQLGFDAEDAALNEKKAALELEKARETLLRVQDLPPNSRARKEAELAFQEAELNYRRAIDQNSDLAAEQQRIAGDPKNTQGYIDAAQEVADAEAEKVRTIRDGIREEEDARRSLSQAIEDQKDALESLGGIDPFAGLTNSQRNFAEYLVTLKPILDSLKEDVASGFLPVLEEQINRIISSNAMGVIHKGLQDIGDALGVATVNFVDEFLKDENLASLAQVFDTASYSTEVFGSIAGRAFGIIVTVLDAADPLIRRVVDFIESKLGIFDEFLKTENASGELTTFFDMAGDLVANLSIVFGNVFSGIGALISDAVQPGSGAYMLIEWLQDATSGFANLGSDPGGLRTFLQDTAGNAISMFQAVGALFDEIVKLGGAPEIKQFWDTLKGGAPFVGEILENGLEAAPALGALIVSITEIVAAFADSGAPKAFFDTIGAVARGIADFLNTSIVKDFLDSIGPLQGFLLGIGTLLGVAANIFLVIVGTVMKVVEMFKILWTIIQIVGTAIKLAFIASPIGVIVAAVALLVGALVWFFTQTEVGKEMWANFTQFLGEAWQNVVNFFTEVITVFVEVFQGIWEGIVAFFQPVIDGFVTAFTVAFDIIRGIVDVFVAVFTIAFVLIGTVVQGIWDGIQAGFQAVSDFLEPIIDGIQSFFETVFGAIGDFIGDVWDGIQRGFQAFYDWVKPVIDSVGGFFETVFDGVSSFFKGIMNGMIGFAEGFINFFIDGLNFIIEKINTIKLKIPELMQPLFGGQKEIGFSLAKVSRISLPRLAEGGVARATTGGILAQIAEGGRNERIEPLDPNGLSARDKAMIELLAGKAGGAGQTVQIVVNPAPGMNERELAQAVSKQLAIQMRKGSIA